MNAKKIIILVSVLAVILVLVFTSFSIVGPTERGIKVTLGVADEEVLGPGLKFKTPFFQKVQKYDLTPIQYASAFNSVTDAAITLDKQSILVNFELFWRYDESKLYNVATRYKTRESLYQPISTSLKGIIKDCVGKKSINEITANQSQLTTEVIERLVEDISYLPIIVDKFTITNIDWSAEYDRQIEETAKLSQQVEQAKQQALIVEAEAQKQVKEAQARLEAEKLNAEAEIAKAEGEAKAKKFVQMQTLMKHKKLQKIKLPIQNNGNMKLI
jgi:membrane protease subunit HflC